MNTTREMFVAVSKRSIRASLSRGTSKYGAPGSEMPQDRPPHPFNQRGRATPPPPQ